MNETDFVITEAPYDYESPLHYTERIFLAMMSALIAVVGLLGNGLVITGVALSRKLRTATNVYVVNLSIADMFTCILMPFHVIAVLSTETYPLAEWTCSIAAASSIISSGCSIFTLAAIALNRLFLVTQPSHRYRSFYRTRNLVFTTLLTWIVPTVFTVFPPLFSIGEIGFDEKYTRCGPKHTDNASIYDMMLATIFYPGPLVIIIVCYCKIFAYVKRHMKTMSSSEPSSSSFPPKTPSDAVATSPPMSRTSESAEKGEKFFQDLNRRQTKQHFSRRQLEITRNLFYVVIAFFLCLTPYSVSLMIPGSDHIVPYAGAIYLLGSCVNPFIYATKHPHFKNVIRCIIQCRFTDIDQPAQFLRRIISNKQMTHIVSGNNHSTKKEPLK
ncbi:alpha-1A adrenergic receptor-like [Lytechinus pictus]|uniref:alpha-1A adrenergic receptor-like n=1 Tax=Lytechinus pictus TaxID=7653 RepID=UPI00240E762F|nr:alpha-1A adrenergic receptor-like [Lytechinus pictus]